MSLKFTGKNETKFEFGNHSKTRAVWRSCLGVLLALLCVHTIRSVRAETLTLTNSNPLVTPDAGPASLYPSNCSFGGFPGTVTAVRIILHNITHSFPGDYDIMLAGPGGRKALLMSDCGAGNDLSNVTLTFTDGATATLPQSAQITSDAYRPINYGPPSDVIPPAGPLAYSSSLATFNGGSPNGTWSLYVVDDAGGDTGTIAGGWTIEIDTTGFRNSTGISVPDSGPATPYPSIIPVDGFTAPIKAVQVSLFSITHSFPSDLDILLAGPGGNALIMSDAGAGADIANLSFVLDDAAANALSESGPLVAGTFRPTNFGAGDTFPLPAPNPAGGSALSAFANTSANGLWNLFVVDDQAQDSGSIGSWNLNFEFPPTVLANISTRLPVETGDNVLIGGFIVTGTQAKKVIIRAIGPSLALPGRLSDTTLELRDSNNNVVWFNDDWNSGALGYPSQEAEIIATGIPPSSHLESAILVTLPANGASYTAIVRGYQGATGIALVEAYDLDRAADSKLANISTRGLVQTDDNVLIAGTILLGTTSQKVVLRALGPSLPVPGALTDPVLELYDHNGTLIMMNDDWKDAQEGEITETTIPPSHDFESAMVVTLPSGGASYTAIVRGLNGATGVAVVEMYALQ